MVELSNEREKRTYFAKSIEKRTELMNKNLYKLPALTSEEALKEKECLKKRRNYLKLESPGVRSKYEIFISSTMMSKLKLLLPPSDYVQ